MPIANDVPSSHGSHQSRAIDDRILSFLNHLDAALLALAQPGQHFDMYHLGRSALVMHHQFQFSTRDIDIVAGQNGTLDQPALDLLGRNTPLAQQLGLYLDAIPPGEPPLPSWFKTRCQPVTGPWKVVRLWKLEDHDLAATKLKCFRPQDRADLQAMCDRGLLNAAKLYASLDAAFPFRSPKPEDAEHDPDNPAWGKALTNYKRVEDYLNGKITSI